jgi:hypothetical protein
MRVTGYGLNEQGNRNHTKLRTNIKRFMQYEKIKGKPLKTGMFTHLSFFDTFLTK